MLKIDSLWPGLYTSAGVYVAGVFAQAATSPSGVDWLNVGAVGAITLLFSYIITKRDPAIQEKHAQTIQYHIDKTAEVLKFQAQQEADRDKFRTTQETERQKQIVEAFSDELRLQREQNSHWLRTILSVTAKDEALLPLPSPDHLKARDQ